MKDFFYRNPWVRTFLPLLLLTAASITTNTLVVEITNGTVVNWREIPNKASFYIVLLATLLTGLYEVTLFKSDTLLLKGITPRQYEAALRNRVLEESANMVNKLIHEGDLDKLKEATATFKNLFGESGE